MRKNRMYIIASAMVLCASFGLTALYSHNQKQEQVRLEQEIAEQEATQKQLAAQEEEVKNASSVVPPKNTSIENSALAAIEETKEEMANEIIEGQIEMPQLLVAAPETEPEEAPVSVTEPSLHFSADSELMWPMDGNVIMNYSMESTIYHATLDQYKYNPAIIIAGEVNNKVYAVAQGQITDISQNEVTGMTVTVDLGDGYQVIYGQLKELNFEVGDYLEAGHVIGYVSEPTKYYSVEGSNLYFEMQKDGAPIDPIAYFE